MTTIQHLSIGTRMWFESIRGPRSDRGEGVISAAIAVLIMAFIGALMWVGFRTIWEDAESNTADCVDAIGSDSGDCGGGG